MFKFEKMEVWKKSMDLADHLFDLSDKLDESHKYRLAEQLRSSALSISNNIAEGSGSLSRGEFREYLNHSHRHVSETANLLILCRRKKLITEGEKTRYLFDLEEISRMMNGFSNSV